MSLLESSPELDPTPSPSPTLSPSHSPNPNPSPTPSHTPLPAPSGLSFYKDGNLAPEVDALFKESPEARSFFAKYGKAENPYKAMGEGIKGLQFMAAQKGLEPLAADAPQAAKDVRNMAIRKALGVPDKIEGYGLKKPDNLPAGLEWDDNTVTEYAEIALKHNVSPEAMQALVAKNLEIEGKRAGGFQQQSVAALQAEKATLTQKHGDKLPMVYASAIRGAEIAAGMTGIPVEQIKAMATNSAMVEVLHAFAQATSEDKFVSSSTKGSPGQTYMEQANDIMTNPANPFHEAWKKGDEHAVAEKSRLTRLATTLGAKR